ncbi:MAG: hypothetical protein RIR05_880 [Bacteroidota bacterium]|jgi:hypothetical protein|nr:hypothetical protein [Bacteroidia bacterium]NBX19352.1 hypothetical protein [Bacteroidia bacterium]NBY10822.1 hypothetical protein [Sphingobacteriia bacterium]
MIFRYVCIIFSVLHAIGQTPVLWKASTQYLNSNHALTFTFEAEIAPGWHMYSQHLKADGPVPTHFDFSKCPGFIALTGLPEEIGIQREFVPAFGDTLLVFHNRARFIQSATASVLKPFSFDVAIDYMLCNERMCLPPKTEIVHVKSPVK